MNWIERACYYATDDDRKWFARAIEGLKENGTGHCDPHSVRSFKLVYDIVHPVNVLEIGFNGGHSAAIWFALGVDSVHSLDIVNGPLQRDACLILNNRYQGRHFFTHIDSRLYVPHPTLQPDLLFIDGGHEVECVQADIVIGKTLKVPYFFFDDWHPRWGPGVQLAISQSNLCPLFVAGNMALCVDPFFHSLTIDEVRLI